MGCADRAPGVFYHEPMATQPLMYKAIQKHPTTRKLYAEKLAAEGVVDASEPEEMVKTFRNAMDGGHHTNQTILSNYRPPFSINWKKYQGTKWNEHDDTFVSIDTLKMLGEKLTQVPANFRLHPRVERIIADRRQMAQGKLPRLDGALVERVPLDTHYSLLANADFARAQGEIDEAIAKRLDEAH